MLNLRIQGLVSLANAIKAELRRPGAVAGRRAQLQRMATQVLTQVRDFLSTHRASPADLPSPSRSALHVVEQFAQTPHSQPLSLFETSAFPVAPKLAAPPPSEPSSPFHMTGLTSVVNQIAARLSSLPDPGTTSLLHTRIADTSRRTEARILARKFSPEQLTTETRAARAWLAYFSAHNHVERYLTAVRSADAILRPASRKKPRLVRDPNMPVIFKPIHGYYILRRGILTLPTAMIAFEEDQFAILARMIFGDDSAARNELFHAVMAGPFQSLRATLDQLGGIVEKPVGVAHDLADSFARVNEKYFGNSLARPALVWSRQLTGRKFGHFDFIQDTVMLSRTLDSHEVPRLVVDYIMFHELLHKKHGIRWANGRQQAHTREFRREEQRFEGFADAEKMLQDLASRHRRRRQRS